MGNRAKKIILLTSGLAVVSLATYFVISISAQEVIVVDKSVEADQQWVTPQVRLTLSGNPAGGTVTLRLSGGSIPVLIVNTLDSDTIPMVVANLRDEVITFGNEMGVPDGSVGLPLFSASVDVNDSNSLIIDGSDVISFDSTDFGISALDSVSNLSAILSATNDTVQLTWEIPTGISYDEIIVSQFGSLITVLTGSAVDFTDTSIFRLTSMTVEEGQMFEYSVIGVKDDLFSRLTTVEVEIPTTPLEEELQGGP